MVAAQRGSAAQHATQRTFDGTAWMGWADRCACPGKAAAEGPCYPAVFNWLRTLSAFVLQARSAHANDKGSPVHPLRLVHDIQVSRGIFAIHASTVCRCLAYS